MAYFYCYFGCSSVLEPAEMYAALRAAGAWAHQPIHLSGLMCLHFLQGKGPCTFFTMRLHGNQCMGVPLEVIGTPMHFLCSTAFTGRLQECAWFTCTPAPAYMLTCWSTQWDSTLSMHTLPFPKGKSHPQHTHTYIGLSCRDPTSSIHWPFPSEVLPLANIHWPFSLISHLQHTLAFPQ